MMPRRRVLASLLAAAALGVTVITAPAAAPAAANPPPPGTVLATAPMTLSSELSAVGTAKRLAYVTTLGNQRIVTTGVIITPKAPLRPQPGQRWVVAGGHGTEGVADRCAPSRHANLDPDPNYPFWAREVAGLVGAGYTLALADYPGLGEPNNRLTHPYLVRDAEGRSVIDAVRAARNLDGTLGNKWVSLGHSQGGQAALGAAELAAGYGQGLVLSGAVGVAPASELDTLAQGIPGTPGNGLLALAVYGYAAVYPGVVPGNILAPEALAIAQDIGLLNQACYNEVLAGFYGLTAEQMVVGGSVPPALVSLFGQNNVGYQHPGPAVLLVHNEADAVVPEFVSAATQAGYCGLGVPTQRLLYPADGSGIEHDTVLDASRTDVLSWVADRFGGSTPPSNCP